MKVQKSVWQGSLLGVLAVAVAACGDPNLKEQSGYTRAPLGQPGLIGQAEQPGEMARYGGPRRMPTERIQLPEQVEEAAAPVARAPVELPPGVTQDMVAQGEALYATGGNCQACHAAGGTGTPLAPALNDGGWIHIDGSFDEIVRIISDGVAQPAQYPAPMPARGGAPISDDDVRLIAAYVYAISRQ
ncbi:MAG TPA: cytochrome c [Longimicrobiales bacterium]|nr:cytochrome c [Longimicrobiales bacterium]